MGASSRRGGGQIMQPSRFGVGKGQLFYGRELPEMPDWTNSNVKKAEQELGKFKMEAASTQSKESQKLRQINEGKELIKMGPYELDHGVVVYCGTWSKDGLR